jgi:hypothetical protein
MESWEKLGDHLSARADRRGYAHAQQTVFVSDGAWDALWKRSPLASMA